MPKKKPNRPEKTFGPYPGGIGVAVWMNEFDGDDGPRSFRSITINPRRYRDSDTGEWRDANSFRPGDLPALIFGLQKALEFVFEAPLPGESDSEKDAPY